MRRKYLVMFMGIMMTITSAPVMAAEEGGTVESQEISAEPAGEKTESGQSAEILGQVTALADNTVTVAVGTGDQQEEQTVSVTDTTEITRQAMGKMPEGEAPGEGVPGAESETITFDDIQVGDEASITLDEEGNAAAIAIRTKGGGQQPGGEQGPQGQSQKPENYEAANTYTEDTSVEDTSLESTGTDENAALVSEGAEVTFDNVTITRNSEESAGGDSSSFYGVGAALLAEDGSAYVKGGTVETDAAGGAGLFAYGDGTVYAADTTIATEKDTSGGIHAAGGGTFYGWDLNVETNGESSAAIRSDRGGGTMIVDGGNYTSNGVNSPAVYSTADIAVNNATLTANGSEAVCIEGKNSLRLYDCNLTGNMSDLDQNDNTWTVILYQSMSGDSEVGNSVFQMDGGTLTSGNGGVFYTTNTESTFVLKDVEIVNNDDNEFFLQCTGNTNERGWGTAGSNGADCLFTAISQEMQGDIVWDSISQLDFYLTDGSSLSGAFVDEETYAGTGGDGYCSLYISEDSTWTVTGDSTVTNLFNAGTIVDNEGKTVTVQGTDGTVYEEGDSAYTVTVESYSSSADISGAGSVDEWGSYQMERPENL